MYGSNLEMWLVRHFELYNGGLGSYDLSSELAFGTPKSYSLFHMRL